MDPWQGHPKTLGGGEAKKRGKRVQKWGGLGRGGNTPPFFRCRMFLFPPPPAWCPPTPPHPVPMHTFLEINL